MSNCTTFNILDIQDLVLENEVFLSTNCISGKTRLALLLLFIIWTFFNIVSGILLAIKDYFHYRSLTLQRSTVYLALLNSCSRFLYFMLVLFNDQSFARYFFIIVPPVFPIMITTVYSYNWLRVILSITYFYKHKEFQPYLRKVGVGAIMTCTLILLTSFCLVTPCYFLQKQLGTHNILLASSQFVLSIFAFGFSLGLWFIGNRLRKILNGEVRSPQVSDVEQRIHQFQIRIMISGLGVVLTTLGLFIWSVVCFQSDEGMPYAYYLMQLFWFFDAISSSVYLYTNFCHNQRIISSGQLSNTPQHPQKNNSGGSSDRGGTTDSSYSMVNLDREDSKPVQKLQTVIESNSKEFDIDHKLDSFLQVTKGSEKK